MENRKLSVLVIGSGGREHAIAWKLAQSSKVESIYLAPGNAGTVGIEKLKNISIQVSDFKGLTQFAVENNVDVVIPGPEQPLVDGIETHFRKVGIPVFGPTEIAAKLEGSKVFSKDFMQRHSVPTASFGNFTSLDEALKYLATIPDPSKIVIKASGLAAGKGVVLPESRAEAEETLKGIMGEKMFGDAGSEVVIEERLDGQELSILAFCDGYSYVSLPCAQDHKRIFDGDEGPNTGGMGAYAPAPIATPALVEQINKQVLERTLTGCRKDGFPFVGLLFVGLMIGQDNVPKVLEYNVRFGDPETQAVLQLLETDFAELIMACVERRLDCIKSDLKIKQGYGVSVVLAASGYPGSYPKGDVIEIDHPKIGQLPGGVNVFHAGTAMNSEGEVVTAGGRVLAVAASGSTLEEAVKNAYNGVTYVKFNGAYFRKDIAHRALKPLTAQNNNNNKEALTYEAAGVNITSGNDLVDAIKPHVKSTKRTGADSNIGSFGGTFDLKATGYKDPILVSGTDGVGTKLKIAIGSKSHETVGIDLVAMSVNDLVVQGAEPFFFLDYYACSKLQVNDATKVIKGVVDGCKLSNCALLGGETAEMPGMYSSDDYDLAGFAVGAVERQDLLPKLDQIQPGDVVIGMSSSGIHSNGFSLVRRVLCRHYGVQSDEDLPWDSPAPWDKSTSLSKALLEPTRIYVQQVLSAVKMASKPVKAMAHITGGGFPENIPRCLPSNVGVHLDLNTYQLPQIFKWLKQEGSVDGKEFARTFNCGVGMVLIVDKDAASNVLDQLTNKYTGPEKAQAWVLGQVTDQVGVQYSGLESW